MTTASTISPGADGACCDEYAAMRATVSRRGLLAGSLALAGTSTLIGSAVLTASPARAASASSVLVVVSMRGAADGLSLVVPHADPVYYAARPRIAVPSDRLLVKDGMFGLHPAMSALVPLWLDNKVAAYHATGLPTANRSHFAAMEELEDAHPGSNERIGWLNRLVGGTSGSSPLQGFSAGTSTIPTSLLGPAPTMSAGDVWEVELPGNDDEGRRAASLRVMWDGEKSTLGKSMRATFEAIDTFGPAQATEDTSDNYPGSSLGRSLATAARIIRGDVGVEVITVDQGDWDMHSDMGSADGGWMANNAEDLATSLAAFLGDLGTQEGKVTAGRDQRVRPSGRRERQQRHRPRLRQRHVRRRCRCPRRLPRALARPVEQLRVRPDRHHGLPPGPRRRRLAPVQRLGRPGLPRAELGVDRRDALSISCR